MSAPLIALEGVHAYYGASHVLHGIDLRLEPGACVSLMGRNGMGKTTTFKTIMGEVRARRGRVDVLGRDGTRVPTHAIARAGVGYVPEGRDIFPNLRVAENLTMAARPGAGGGRAWTLERVYELFPRLAERRGHWGDHLSGGEQQMLTIGRALMTNPRVMLLDEVTEGLAPLIREEIWSVIRAIKAAGIASIIVDKNVGRLIELADRHMILVKGRVVFEGDSDDLAADPDRLHALLGV